MGGWNSQIDNDIDIVSRQQIIDGLGTDAELVGPLLRRAAIHVGTGNNIDGTKQGG